MTSRRPDPSTRADERARLLRERMVERALALCEAGAIDPPEVVPFAAGLADFVAAGRAPGSIRPALLSLLPKGSPTPEPTSMSSIPLNLDGILTLPDGNYDGPVRHENATPDTIDLAEVAADGLSLRIVTKAEGPWSIHSSADIRHGEDVVLSQMDTTGAVVSADSPALTSSAVQLVDKLQPDPAPTDDPADPLPDQG